MANRAPEPEDITLDTCTIEIEVLFPGHAFPPGMFSDDLSMVFYDISNEAERTYIFPSGEFIIDNPLAVAFCSHPPAFGGGSHRVVDKVGNAHYVPYGWIGMRWEKANDDDKPFNF